MPNVLPKPWYKKVVDNLAIKYNKDRRVIEYISHYPFSFLKQVVLDEDNQRPVRLRHLGVFFLKDPNLKNIVYEKRVLWLRTNMKLLVENELFESEEVGLATVEAMTKTKINQVYKKHRILMKQI